MIRHLVLMKLRDGVSDERFEEVRAALDALRFERRLAFTMSRDAGLREGNMDAALIADFPDEQAYRDYDADPEHDRVRRELLAPIVERMERCQLVI